MDKCIFIVICVLAFGVLLPITDAAQFIESKYNCPKRALSIHPCVCEKATDDGLTIRCINTNLASLSLALANIKLEQAPIDSLFIERSHFAALIGTMFIDLKINKISIRNTPIEKIDEYMFYGVNETLRELELIDTRLLTFPTAVKILGKATHLIINGHNITSLDANAIADGPIIQKLERLHLSNGLISDVPVEFLQVFRKLKTLDLHGNQLIELKRNQFKNLRELEMLDISHNEITKLDSSHVADLTKLGWCNVSHNALNEITRGTFARNSVLRLLNLSHNKIKRLDANSFRGMRFLRRLLLSDNIISDIGRGTFAAINRIGTIDLARNQLKKVDYQMFAQLNYIEIIDLAENNITELQKQSFKDLYLTHINISHNAINKFESHAFENCVNMTTLDLSHNAIKTFDRNAFDELSYATVFLLSYNQLENMTAVPLGNMTGLKFLNVSHNQIIEIPKNTFPKLYELHTIDLSHNNLTNIFNGVFQTLFSLRSLNLSSNQMGEIKAATFGTLPTLLEMHLDRNGLRAVARGAFTKLSSLRSLTVAHNELPRIFDIPISLNALYMRDNRVTDIPIRTWPVMNSLLDLDLRDNALGDRLNGDSFSGLITLRYLKLSNNNITIIPRDAFTILSTLQYLYLDENNITEIITAAFGRLPVVFELHLRNNQITNISSNAFDGLLQLLKLDLSMNQIQNIPSNAFTGLVSLRSLDLSYNQLKRLDNRTNGVLDDCLSLERINLSHNMFSLITKKTFPSDPYIPYHLQEIDLSYNEMPVLTYDLAFGTQKVKFLNLSHNNINEFRRNVLSNLTQLKTLDLSYNDIDTLDSIDFKFNFPINLTELHITNNRLRRLPMHVFKNVSTMTTIDIQNNTIMSFDADLLRSVKNGLHLFIAGNPLHCDCLVRPLTHYYRSLLNAPTAYNNIICESPDTISNRPLSEIPDDNFNCINATQPAESDLNVLSDLNFREIFYSRGNLSVRWIVTQTNKDIAGFYVVIRNIHNRILIEHHLSYDKRTDDIIGGDICSGNCMHLELCVLSKSSLNIINGWFDTQCIYLPNDFERIQSKYDENNGQIYVIHSLRKQIRAQSAYDRFDNSANAANQLTSSIRIMLTLVASVLLTKIIPLII